MELDENIMQLIIMHLNDEASEKEKLELENWLQQTPAHQEEYDAYRKLWIESPGVVLKHKFNTTEAWKKLDERLRPSLTTGKSATMFSFKRMAVAAAILLFVVMTTVYFFNTKKENSWQNVAAQKSTRQITLPDGSVVTLRKGSTFRYLKDFGKKERLSQLNGEAFFEVEPNERKPFRVTSPKAIVEVLGTSFLVRSTDSTSEVVVREGKVRFAERNNLSHNLILTKGQKAVLAKSEFKKDTVLTSNDTAWKSGKLIFHNTPLSRAAEDISHFYNVEVKLAPDLAQEAINIKAEFENDTLEQVLDEIQLITGLKISKEQNVIIISN